MGDCSTLLAGADYVPAVDLRVLANWSEKVRRMALDGDFAAALAMLNRLAAAVPCSGAFHIYRAALLDVLDQQDLALADYRAVFKEFVARFRGIAIRPPWPSGPSAADVASGPRPMRNSAATLPGRPDAQDNRYVYIAEFLLDPQAKESALLADVDLIEPASQRPEFRAGVDYFIGVRRQLAGDRAEPGMREKAAAGPQRTAAVRERTAVADRHGQDCFAAEAGVWSVARPPAPTDRRRGGPVIRWSGQPGSPLLPRPAWCVFQHILAARPLLACGCAGDADRQKLSGSRTGRLWPLC